MNLPTRILMRDSPLLCEPRGDEGHTLVEVVVALAIFLTVLVPLGAVISFAAEHRADVTGAIALAQTEMETVLAMERYASMERRLGKWHVISNVAAEAGLASITVSVYRNGRPQPVVALETVRPGQDP
jgi:hypothetical protein